METQKEKLGKVSITVEKDYWSVNKTYKKLTIVERQGTGTTYISRKPVPAGTSINNRLYWIKFSKWSDIPYEITQDLGDSEELAISQKAITKELNRIQHKINEQDEYLQNQIDELKEAKAVVSLTINPALIEVGQATVVSFNATSDETATKIEVFAAGELIKSGENIKTLTGTLGTPFISGTPEELEVTAEFSYNNNHKSASAVVTSVLPIYYGAGEGYAAASNKASLRTSPAGIYQVNVSVADKYVYFVIPDSMEIRGAKMGGFDFPLEDPEIIMKAGKPYKGYRSSNTYDVGVLTIEIL